MRLPVSNATLERRSQHEKHHEEMVSTDEGMQIDANDEQSANAHSPRSETRQPLSNVTLRREMQPEKEKEEIVSTDAGLQIDSREEQSENA
jgi:hypothetical protein